MGRTLSMRGKVRICLQNIRFAFSARVALPSKHDNSVQSKHHRPPSPSGQTRLWWRCTHTSARLRRVSETPSGTCTDDKKKGRTGEWRSAKVRAALDSGCAHECGVRVAGCRCKGGRAMRQWVVVNGTRLHVPVRCPCHTQTLTVCATIGDRYPGPTPCTWVPHSTYHSPKATITDIETGMH